MEQETIKEILKKIEGAREIIAKSNRKEREEWEEGYGCALLDIKIYIESLLLDKNK